MEKVYRGLLGILGTDRSRSDSGSQESDVGKGGKRMTKPIRCKVVRILSDRELILDAGSSQGVQDGMVFNVMGSLSVMDIEGGSLLETLELVKLSVRVSLTGERVAVVETYHNVDSELKQILAGSAFVSQHEKIKARTASTSDEWDGVVHVGDTAVQQTDAD